MDEQHHHHHQAPNGQASAATDDVRQSQVFPGYPGSYPPNSNVGGPSMAPAMHDGMGMGGRGPSTAIAARSKSTDEDNVSLFSDIPEVKKRKFILVDDPSRGQRIRVRVTLDTVDTTQIPDSYRKNNSVYPRSWFPMQMQSPPPSAHGSRFFEDDDMDDDDSGRPGRGKTMVPVPMADGTEAEVATPKMRKSQRRKEVKLNDLGYRMAWHQSRAFSGRAVFLQRAREYLMRNSHRGI
jgi:hypothetical protein